MQFLRKGKREARGNWRTRYNLEKVVAIVPASIRAGEPSGMVLPWDFGVPSLMLSPRLRSFEAGSVSPLLFHSSPSPPLVYQLYPFENPSKQTPFQHQSLSLFVYLLLPLVKILSRSLQLTLFELVVSRETNPHTFSFLFFLTLIRL